MSFGVDNLCKACYTAVMTKEPGVKELQAEIAGLKEKLDKVILIEFGGGVIVYFREGIGLSDRMIKRIQEVLEEPE